MSRRELEADLDISLPESLGTGCGNTLFLCGWCFHPRLEIRRLELRVGDVGQKASAWGMPRPDALQAHPDAKHAFRSGFWGAVAIAPSKTDVTAEVLLAATLADGSEHIARLGEVELLAGGVPVERTATPEDAGDRVAICMTTFDPPIDLFERQVESLRAQTYGNWTCVIGDDRSDPARLAQVRAVLDGDRRFVLHTSPRRQGFYRNFEHTLSLLPPDVPLVALCDQDDRWHPDKLETLVAALGSARLVYSDQRVVDPAGGVLAGSYWTRRRNNFSDLASLLVANTVTGAASLFRRDLLDLALPFPHAPGGPYHDHWLALVALASGRIAYVDRPLYDYVQHESAHLGHARANRAVSAGPRFRLRRGWRAIYFYDYWRLRVFALVLLGRCGDALSPAKRRTLERFLATDSSVAAFAWLAARGVRPALGLNETLGADRGLIGAIVWRRLVELSPAIWRGPLSFLPRDASLPPRVGTRPSS